MIPSWGSERVPRLGRVPIDWPARESDRGRLSRRVHQLRRLQRRQRGGGECHLYELVPIAVLNIFQRNCGRRLALRTRSEVKIVEVVDNAASQAVRARY